MMNKPHNAPKNQRMELFNLSQLRSSVFLFSFTLENNIASEEQKNRRKSDLN